MGKYLFALFMAFLPLLANANDNGKCGENVTYTYNSTTGTLTIEGSGDMDDYQMNYYTAPWKYYLNAINKIIIKDGVTSIGGLAFWNCTSLTSITIPSSVKTIGDYAFYGCTSLSSITIPSSVTLIKGYAFNYCTSLTSITIPSSVKTIGDYAFYQCSRLTSVNLSNGVKTIGGYAFYDCPCLSSLTIPSSVTSLGSRLSRGIAKIIWLPNTPPTNYLEAGGGMNYVSNNQYHFTYVENTRVYPFLSSIFEKDGIKYVPVSPSERTCDAIDCVYDSSSANLNISSNVTYEGVVMTVQKVLPYTFCNNTYIETFTFDLEDKIANYTFYVCKNMKQMILGEKVSDIGDYAFQDCSSLQSIVIPNSVKELGEASFSGCIELQKISIPKSVTNIKINAFSGCSGIRELIIENRTEELRLGYKSSEVFPGKISNAPIFSDCPLDSVYIGGDINYDTSPQCGYSPFYRNKSLRTVFITDKETEISANEFYGCARLQSFKIGDGVTTFGDWAFSGCSSLKSLSFGTQLNYIGKEAFSDCSSVIEITSKAATPPLCETQALDDINKWNCKVYVPQGCITSYQAADQWKDFFFIVEDEGNDSKPDNKKCSKPTIGYHNCKLNFNCDTDGAICHSTITDDDIMSFDGNEIQLGVTYHISVYASKEGYENSETATATLCWIDVEPKTEGITDGMAQISARAVMVKAESGQLTVEGADDNTNISVYTIDGVQAGATTSRNGVASVITDIPKDSMAIVKIGNKSVKVMMK